jgi:pimeloyl-ACP methyl ester carboxylesterase
MKTFILIHGSWHGSWNWHRVIPILEKQGHRAIAIDLPGMGRDKTPIAEVKMKSTVQKICTLIDGIEGKVILVGHSKNGIMISQAAEHRPDKIEKISLPGCLFNSQWKNTERIFLARYTRSTQALCKAASGVECTYAATRNLQRRALC